MELITTTFYNLKIHVLPMVLHLQKYPFSIKAILR